MRQNYDLMAKRVLITGGSGLVGSRLTELLQQKGYQVCHLGRAARELPVKTYSWDLVRNTFDPDAFTHTDFIIHLAGAGVADQRWTPSRKKEILDSRVLSTRLLARALKEVPNQVQAVASASAVGYYGFAPGAEWFTEESGPGTDFLAEVTRAWEDEVQKIAQPVSRLRIGIVLSKHGGALPQLMRPVNWGVGAPLASGQQYMSWIHIDDLCAMFIHALEHRLTGAYNAVGPNPVTNREMTHAIARELKRPLWLPAVPAFVLKAMLGEMANMVVFGNRVSNEKIVKTGFTYQFATLESALHPLLAGK